MRWDAAASRLVLLRTVEHEDDVATDFEPPLVVLPDSLGVGDAPFTQSLRMVVRERANPSRIKAEGDATQEISREPDETLVTALGPLRAARVRSVLRARLGPAEVVSTSVTWYHPELGPIAETRREVVRVLGLTTRDASQSWVVESVTR